MIRWVLSKLCFQVWVCTKPATVGEDPKAESLLPAFTRSFDPFVSRLVLGFVLLSGFLFLLG